MPRISKTLRLLALAFVPLAALPAAAHPGHAGSERLLKLDLVSQPPRFSYALILGADQASALRKQADGDADGAVSAREQQTVMTRLTRDFLQALRTCRGPSLADLHCASVLPGQLASTGSEGWTGGSEAAVVLSWEVQLALSDGDAALRVEEAWRREHVARTSALIEPHPERALALAHAGARTSEAIALEASWSDADEVPEPRVLAAEWRRPSRAWLVGPAAAAAALAAAWLSWRRRRAPAS